MSSLGIESVYEGSLAIGANNYHLCRISKEDEGYPISKVMVYYIWDGERSR